MVERLREFRRKRAEAFDAEVERGVALRLQMFGSVPVSGQTEQIPDREAGASEAQGAETEAFETGTPASTAQELGDLALLGRIAS